MIIGEWVYKNVAGAVLLIVLVGIVIVVLIPVFTSQCASVSTPIRLTQEEACKRLQDVAFHQNYSYSIQAEISRHATVLALDAWLTHCAEEKQ